MSARIPLRLEAETVPIARKPPASCASGGGPTPTSRVRTAPHGIGYAVRADEYRVNLKSPAKLRAGQSEDRQLAPGQAIRILTERGDARPGLRVVLPEHVRSVPKTIRRAATPGTNIRSRGETRGQGRYSSRPAPFIGPAAAALLAPSVKVATARFPPARASSTSPPATK